MYYVFMIKLINYYFNKYKKYIYIYIYIYINKLIFSIFFFFF